MSWSFNPFTGNLDLVGGGAVVFEGEVETFADLPETVGDPAVGASFLVRSSTGVWLVNRRQAGIWIRKNNTGVRATDWEYGGDYPVNSVNGQTGNVVLGSSDVGAAAATHAASHYTGGSDQLRPQDIGAQSIFVTEDLGTVTANVTLTASRAKIWKLNTTTSGLHILLPTTGVLAGDVAQIIFSSSNGQSITPVQGTMSGFFTANLSPFGEPVTFIAEQSNGTSWTIQNVDKHAHGNITNLGCIGTISDLPIKTGAGGAIEVGAFGTSAGEFAEGNHTHGNLTNDGKIGSAAGLPVVTTIGGAITTLPLGTADQVLKVNSGGTALEFGAGGGFNAASPPAIGSTTPAAGTFTNLVANTELQVPSAAAPSPSAGDIYRVSDQIRYRDSGNTERALLNSRHRVLTGNATAATGEFIAANTTAGAFTLTLPASPSNGDTVSILDYAGTFNTNNLTIARNGSNIESLAENMDCNIRNAAFSLVFVGATIGWKVVPYFGSSVNFSSPNPIGNSVPNTGAFTTLTANSLTSGLLSATPAANASGITSTSYSLTGSNAQSLVDLSGTWNTTGTPTAFRLNVTNTASNAASLLMDLQTGGTTQFSVRRDGVINAALYYRFTGLNSGLFVHSAGGGVLSIGDSPNNWMTLTSTRMQLTGDLSLGRALSAGQSADTILARDAANTVAQVNGTNAQTFRLYNTFTSTTNFERLNIIAQSAASVIIGTEKGSGGGSARGLELRTDNVARINISATGGIGFFGAAAAAQPAAVADATDAATVITQLNALLSRMRTLGLIAT